MGKRKLIEKECPQCHKVFNGRKSQTFCSRNCSGTFSGPKSAGISKKGKSPIEKGKSPIEKGKSPIEKIKSDKESIIETPKQERPKDSYIENLVKRFQSIPKPSPNEWKGVPGSLAYNSYIYAKNNPNKATLENFMIKYDKYIEQL